MLARYHRRTMDTGITQQIREPMAYLRGNPAGLIRFDENVLPIKIVIGLDGRIVAPVMVATLTAGHVLHLPDEGSSMHLMVTLESFEEKGPDGALADRWRIYHGELEDVRWAIMHIDAARLNGVFYDGDALLVPNVLSRCEASICRWANGRWSTGFDTPAWPRGRSSSTIRGLSGSIPWIRCPRAIRRRPPRCIGARP